MARQHTINLGTPLVPSVQDQELFTEATRIYNALNQLAFFLDQYTGRAIYSESEVSQLTPLHTAQIGNLSFLYVQASETITAGQLVTFHDAGSELRCKKAGGSSYAGDVRGYADQDIVSGATGKIVLLGLYTYSSGLTPGNVYWNSNVTAGNLQSGKPTTSGHIAQAVGYAVSDSILFFNPSFVTEQIP